MTPVWVHSSHGPAFEAVSAFTSYHIWGEVRPFSGNTALAVFDGQQLIAGVVFHNFEEDRGVVEVSGASTNPRFMTRRVLWEIYDYAFNQLGCQAVMQNNDPDDTRLNRQMKAYGFQRYDIPRLRGRDKAAAIHVLTEEAWRANGFHKENRHGQSAKTDAAA